MDFWRSVFSNEEEAERGAESPSERSPGGAESNPSSPGGGGSAWGGFGSLIKTLASKSESVIQTYQQDLQEFGSGFRMETTAIRDVIKDFPFSLEVGASVAQESLESVGQAIDDIGDTVWREATNIIAHSKDSILSLDSSYSAEAPVQSSSVGSGGTTRSYSRFEVKVMALQSNKGTFTEEPDDAEDFQTWIASFQLVEKEEEIAKLLAENEVLEINMEELVPEQVDNETFWARYFYKIYKLKQAEDARADLVKRALVEEEDLSWDVDDDDYEEDGKEDLQGRQGRIEEQRNPPNLEKDDPSENPQVRKSPEVSATSSGEKDDQILHETEAKPDQPSTQEEDDLGWDEIEDLGEVDSKRISNRSPADLRKRLSSAEDEEDLSWDM